MKTAVNADIKVQISVTIYSQFGYSYWSLSGYIKSRLIKAAEAIRNYEAAAIQWAKSEGYDGIVCGHIHQNNIRFESGVLYCNDGDWIESCTSLIETRDGQIKYCTGATEPTWSKSSVKKLTTLLL